MAVQAERGVTDSVLIEKTRVILDALTPQALESEFSRVLEQIQERRELIQVLGELDPKLIAELRQEDVEEDGSREYLQDDAELRTSFGIDVIDGRIVNVTTAPFLIVEINQVWEYQWTKGQPKAYEASIESKMPVGYSVATRWASKEFSRLRVNPDQLDLLQKHDRIHFVIGHWNTPDLLIGIDKVASEGLRNYLTALRCDIMPAGSMSPINWFKILAHTDYTGSVTLHVPVDTDAHMGDEMQLAVEAAVKSNLAYVKDNWERIRIATGLDLVFDKDRFDEFSSRVTVKVAPATVDGTAITIATEPLIKDVQ